MHTPFHPSSPFNADGSAILIKNELYNIFVFPLLILHFLVYTPLPHIADILSISYTEPLPHLVPHSLSATISQLAIHSV